MYTFIYKNTDKLLYDTYTYMYHTCKYVNTYICI